MPYIKEESRVIARVLPNTAGELNYAITMLCLEYISRKGECYQSYNDVIGVLECSKAEQQRRWVGPYEDIKIKQNGDIV